MIKKLISLLALTATVFLLISCAPEKKRYVSYNFEYFDTVTSITGYAKSKEEFDSVCKKAYLLLEEYHKLYDIYYTYGNTNNLCALNKSGGNPLKMDPKIIDLLEYAKDVYRLTNGFTDISMGNVLRVWHDHREEGTSVPTETELSEAALHTNIDNVLIDKINGTVQLADPEMSVDVGALAKGYAAEKTASALRESGVYGYILNVGGNVCVLGTKADGSFWTVGIEDPLSESEFTEYLSLCAGSVVTSGSYQRNYYVDGKCYHHIISPETLMPSNSYVSVSVITQNSALGDALSTALFSMEIEDGKKLIESIYGTEAMWVFSNGEKVYSSGFRQYIK